MEKDLCTYDDLLSMYEAFVPWIVKFMSKDCDTMSLRRAWFVLRAPCFEETDSGHTRWVHRWSK